MLFPGGNVAACLRTSTSNPTEFRIEEMESIHSVTRSVGDGLSIPMYSSEPPGSAGSYAPSGRAAYTSA